MLSKRLPQLPETRAMAFHNETEGHEDSTSTRSPYHAPMSNPPPFSRYLSSPTTPFSSPNLPVHTPRRTSGLTSPFTPSLEMPDDPSGRKKAFWRKLSTPPSTSPPSNPRSNSTTSALSAPPTPTPMNDVDAASEHGSKHSGSRESPGPGGLGRKRSSGQLLADFGRGLSRVGSVMKRTPIKSDELPSTPQRQTPTRQGSKLGLSKQGSIRRQMQQGSWRGKKLADSPETVAEEEEEREGNWQDIQREGVVVDVGDEGIGRPFNVAHDLHITPDLDNLPLEWIAALKAQGMSEAELLTIAAARKRQASAARPLHNRTNSARRTSQRRKKGHVGSTSPTAAPAGKNHKPTAGISSENDGVTRVQLSDKPISSPSSSSTKQRLPALTHLDDHRPSVDGAAPNAATTSRGSSLHPSPTSSLPLSAFSTPRRNASSKRLSDQLRGFASLNLDGVGSWADDVLGLVDEAQAGRTPANGKEMKAGPLSSAVMAAEKPEKETPTPRSPRSPRSPRASNSFRRVPVPDVSGGRASNDEAHPARSPTSQSQDTIPLMPGGRRISAAAASPVTPKPTQLPHPVPAAFSTPITSDRALPPMTMSHSHSQSLSTAEDQEIRTPSTSENEDLRTHFPTTYPAPNQRWRSIEAMGWASTPEQPKKVTGKLPSHLELSSPISIPPTARSITAHPTTSGTPTTPHLPIPRTPLNDEYDLSIPSPLRPPPHPHFSLPASAASDAEDEMYDTLSGPEPGSPILRPSEMGLVIHHRCPRDGEHADSDEDHGDVAGMEGMRRSGRGSRKPSEGSIVMIHPYATGRDGESRRGDRGSGSVPDGRPSYTSEKGHAGVQGGGDRTAADITPVHLGISSTRAPSYVDDAPTPTNKTTHRHQVENDHNSVEDDHLSPLPSSAHGAASSSAPSPLHHLAHRTSARSLHSLAAGRESVADSSFSGEGSDYRDSVLGARVMTAQYSGRQEMGRISVFDLGGYFAGEGIAEGEDEAEDGCSGGRGVAGTKV